MTPLTPAWWNAPAFYPSTGVFAFSENLLGLAPIAAPIIAVTNSPLLAYNAAFLLSYVLCGLGAYLLGFVLTRRHDAAFVAAVAFAFAPYRLSHTQHLQLLSSYLDACVDRGAASLYSRGQTALGRALRSKLAAAGARVRLLPVLSHDFRRILARLSRSGEAHEANRGGARGRVVVGGPPAPAGVARLSHDSILIRLQAESCRDRQLQRRRRRALVGGPRFAPVARASRRRRVVRVRAVPGRHRGRAPPGRDRTGDPAPDEPCAGRVLRRGCRADVDPQPGPRAHTPRRRTGRAGPLRDSWGASGLRRHARTGTVMDGERAVPVGVRGARVRRDPFAADPPLRRDRCHGRPTARRLAARARVVCRSADAGHAIPRNGTARTADA